MPSRPPRDNTAGCDPKEPSSALYGVVFLAIIVVGLFAAVYIPNVVKDYYRAVAWDQMFAENRIKSLHSFNQLCSTFFEWQIRSGQETPEFNEYCLKRNKEFFDHNDRP